MTEHTDEFDDAIITRVREVLGPDWLEESGLDGYPACPEGTDPVEWKAFIDAIPPFEMPSEAELDAMAEAYGE